MSLITATLDRFAAPERRTMAVACGAHVLHDGYTDLLYVLLPVWQAEFGLGYAEIGLLRALYVGSMAGFQVPAGLLAERLGGPLILGLGTALAGIGYLIAGASVGFAVLAGGADPRRAGLRGAASDRRPSGVSGLFRPALAHCARPLQFLRRSRQDGVPGGDRLAARR